MDEHSTAGTIVNTVQSLACQRRSVESSVCAYHCSSLDSTHQNTNLIATIPCRWVKSHTGNIKEVIFLFIVLVLTLLQRRLPSLAPSLATRIGLSSSKPRQVPNSAAIGVSHSSQSVQEVAQPNTASSGQFLVEGTDLPPALDNLHPEATSEADDSTTMEKPHKVFNSFPRDTTEQATALSKTAADQPQTQQTCPMLAALPLELRHMIYQEILVDARVQTDAATGAAVPNRGRHYDLQVNIVRPHVLSQLAGRSGTSSPSSRVRIRRQALPNSLSTPPISVLTQPSNADPGTN